MMLIKQKVKYIQSLGQKKFRDAERCFIAEGPKLVKDLLEADPDAIIELYATAAWMEENDDYANQHKVFTVTPEELEKISQLTTPNKVLALVSQYERNEELITKGKVSLVLDAIQDPGNFGTIIRLADWFGISQVIAGDHCADLYNPKVVQSTMGSIARVRVFYRDLSSWITEQHSVPVYATVLEGKDIRKMKPIEEGIILIGNESKGISEELMAIANEKITIPKKGKAESLNAAVATGIVLSYLTP